MAQAATGVGTRGPPREGDGFTFEHLAARRELWLDFCADTGDGGCVARPAQGQQLLLRATLLQKGHVCADVGCCSAVAF